LILLHLGERNLRPVNYRPLILPDYDEKAKLLVLPLEMLLGGT